MLCHDGTRQTPTTECQGVVSRPSAIHEVLEKLHHHVMATVYPMYDSDVHAGTETRQDVVRVV